MTSAPVEQRLTPRLTLGERMKAAEHAYRRTVGSDSYLLLRLDGRAFHTYTRGLDRPYDLGLMDAMDLTLLALCEEIPGVRFGYVESDEISLLITGWTVGEPRPMNPTGVRRSELWMGGVEAKILSLSAACATASFNDAMRHRTDRIALFDSRLWTFPATDEGRHETANYFLWRQRDSIKNSVTMAAHAVFGHSALTGKNTSEKQQMLTDAGQPWEQLPDGFRLGRVATRREQIATVTYVDKRTGTETTTEVTRNPFEVIPAFEFADRDALLAHVPISLDEAESRA